MSTPSLTPGSLRWAGILIVACTVLGLGVVVHLITDGRPLAVGALAVTVAGVVSVLAAAMLLPWQRWTHASALALAVAALLLLLLADLISGYAGSPQAAATYPLFVTLILAWVGLTQPRRTALSFTVCVGAAMALVVLGSPDSAIGLSSLAVVLPAGAALGEAAAWIMGELRRVQRHDERRASTFIDLTRTLDQLPEQPNRSQVAEALAVTASQLFETGATVTLVDGEGAETTAGAGRVERRDRDHAHGGPSPARPLEPAANGGGTLTVAPPKRTTVSLVGRRGILGRVQLDLTRDPDDAYLSNLVRLFAAQSASALERFELLARLDHEITHDELTGTGNRRHATAMLDTLRNGDGIILIDVDGFKAINDSAGHLAGDELLRRLGGYLNSYVRGSDDVARLGGDEFVVVARGVGHGAAAAAGRLLDGWRALQPAATVSIGVAVHRAGDEPSVSLERADQALYQAKRAGRDQVGIRPDETSDSPF